MQETKSELTNTITNGQENLSDQHEAMTRGDVDHLMTLIEQNKELGQAARDRAEKSLLEAQVESSFLTVLQNAGVAVADVATDGKFSKWIERLQDAQTRTAADLATTTADLGKVEVRTDTVETKVTGVEADLKAFNATMNEIRAEATARGVDLANVRTALASLSTQTQDSIRSAVTRDEFVQLASTRKDGDEAFRREFDALVARIGAIDSDAAEALRRAGEGKDPTELLILLGTVLGGGVAGYGASRGGKSRSAEDVNHIKAELSDVRHSMSEVAILATRKGKKN